MNYEPGQQPYRPAAAPNGTSKSQQSNDSSERILRFAINVPVEVALSQKQPDDPIKTSQFGKDEVLYYLVGGRMMYVPMIVADKIARLSPDAEEPFIICKSESKRGQRKGIEWIVEPHPFAPSVVSAPRKPAAAVASAAPPARTVNGPPEPDWGDLAETQGTATPAQAAPATASRQPATASTGPQLVTNGRREKMTTILSDCIQSVMDACSQNQLKLGDTATQALISTLYIQEGRIEEARVKGGWSSGRVQ